MGVSRSPTPTQTRLVDEEGRLHSLLHCRSQDRLGLHAAALNEVHHHHGAIGDTQGGCDLATWQGEDSNFIWVSTRKSGVFTPQIMNFNGVFHYKPSILEYPYFWKHPYICYILKLFFKRSKLTRLQKTNQPTPLSPDHTTTPPRTNLRGLDCQSS